MTGRCLEEDLGAARDAAFEDLTTIEIVKSFVKDRFDRATNTRQVSPLTCGREVWVLARGNDHRAGTWFDEANRVVWMLAYGRHQSGDPGDFFPYCKRLDREHRLLPEPADYELVFRDRDFRFAAAVRIEAPLILRNAREKREEQRVVLGGKYGACVAVEVADDLEETTVAFRMPTVPFDYFAIILQALHPGDWEDTQAMPGRRLDPDEIGFAHMRERGVDDS